MYKISKVLLLVIALSFHTDVLAQTASISINADLVSLYIWRGSNVNDMPNIQPSITLQYGGLKTGFWGSYGLARTNDDDIHYPLTQEIDTWLSYTFDLPGKFTASPIITDYYYANSGIKIGNFSNYNSSNGPGAHLIEGGITLAGPESLPLSLSGYMNIYNDSGYNMYFQADYLFNISDVSLGLFIGGTPGSKENPAYYGTDNFSIINSGIKVSKSIKITENYNIPVSCSYILNPRLEISYLVFGLTL